MLNTAGVTLGTGEGGNAFGDRFFIRGFDARNDVFLDGMRDAGVSVRENFFTEQVEILRGPGSSFAGRGTTGGAINIVTKQATTEKSFYNMDTTFGTDHTKRVVLDVNQVISPTLAVRAGGLFQDAGVAGRDYIKDDRDGGFVAVKWTPLDTVKLYANYIHTNLHGLPDFGVPYYRPGLPHPRPVYHHRRRPVPGFRRQPQQFLRLRQSRLLQHQAGHRHVRRRGHDHPGPDAEQQDQGSALGARLHRNAAGSADRTDRNRSQWTLSLNPQSRYQVTENIANQTEAIYKSEFGGWKNTLAGRRRNLARDREHRQICRPQFGSAAGRNAPAAIDHRRQASSIRSSRLRRSAATPHWTGLPTKIAIDTKSGYLIDTANYNDLVILNGGIRYDDYNIKASGFGTVNAKPNALQCAGTATRHAELQPRPDAEAAAEWQRLCRLCDVVEPGRRRIRRHQRAIWRPGAVR